MVGENWAIWITGLPASGKSTVAKLLKAKLDEMEVNVAVLESDELRKSFTPNPDYSEDERNKFYSRVIDIGKTLTKNGVNVIIDATGHKKIWRETARKEYPQFLEIYLKCPLEICKLRDP